MSRKPEDTFVDFTGYDEIAVLQALIDNIKPTSTLYSRLGKLDKETAEVMITRKSIEYLQGRMLGITFKEFPLIDSKKYDTHHGKGSMEAALQLLYEKTIV
jgi:hypothetical protein